MNRVFVMVHDFLSLISGISQLIVFLRELNMSAYTIGLIIWVHFWGSTNKCLLSLLRFLKLLNVLLPRVLPEGFITPYKLLFFQNMVSLFLDIIQLRLKRFDLRIQSSYIWVNWNTRLNFLRRNRTAQVLRILNFMLPWKAHAVERAAR